MNQAIVDYTFVAASKQITLIGLSSIDVEAVRFIKNLTTNSFIYNFVDTSAGTITVAGNVITFTASNTGMVNTDKLAIQYDVYESVDIQNIDIVDKNKDAFGNIRVAAPYSVFSSKLLRNKEESQFWTTSVLSGGTVSYDSNKAQMLLTVPTTNGAYAIRQSREYINYQPGKSQKILITGVMGVAKTNVTQRIGLFDSNNGVFFEQDITNGLSIVIRSFSSGTAVNTKVLRADWNLDQVSDLDIAKINIFLIDFQWAGRIRFGFVLNGKVRYCHQVNNASLNSVVYISTPNLPIRYEIINTGTAASSTTMQAVCADVTSEGGGESRLLPFSANMGATTRTAGNNTRTPMISIRLKSAYNRIIVIPTYCSVVTGNQATMLEILINATLTTPTWVSADIDSSVEYDKSATSLAGGRLIYTEIISSVARNIKLDIKNIIKLVSNFAGVSDILTVSLSGIGGTSLTCSAAINWGEEL